MNLRQLAIFLTVCELGSMSAAAKKLYMTQPAISQTILDLEADLDIALFDRINKKIILTYPGEVLRTYSKRILTLVEEAEHTMKDMANMKSGRLLIGASTTIGIYLLPDIIGKFRETHSNIDISYVIDNTNAIEEMVLDNQVDIGLVEGLIHSKDIVAKHYVEDELYVICSSNHLLSNKKEVEMAELIKEDIIIREKGSGTREVFEKVMATYHFHYQYKHVFNNTEAIKKAVEANIGIAIVSKAALKDELQSQKIVRLVVKDVQFKRSFHTIYHKDKYHSLLFEEFIRFLYEK